MAKRINPETSLIAHRSLKKSELQELYDKIVWGLGQIGEGTFEDIASAIKEPRERIWRRMKELIDANKVYRPGNTRTLKSGRPGYTYKLTTPGTPSLPVTEKSLPGPTVSDFSKKILQQQLF